MLFNARDRPSHALDEDAFRTLIKSRHKLGSRTKSTRFIKKIDILEVVVPATMAKQKALVISERGIICQFTGI